MFHFYERSSGTNNVLLTKPSLTINKTAIETYVIPI